LRSGRKLRRQTPDAKYPHHIDGLADTLLKRHGTRTDLLS